MDFPAVYTTVLEYYKQDHQVCNKDVLSYIY